MSIFAYRLEYMKTPTKAFFLVTLAISMMFSQSCKKDRVKGCTNSEAINYAESANLEDGSCEFARDKFLGTWSGTKLCSANPLDSTTSIQVIAIANNFRSITITNFPFDGISVTANVNSSDLNKIIIPDQPINNDLDVFNISGEGQVYESDFVINYLRVSGGLIDTCGLGLTKNP